MQILNNHCQCHLINLQTFKFPFYIWYIIKLNQTTVTAFCENTKVPSSDKEHYSFIFIKSTNKNSFVALNQGFLTQNCLLKSIAIGL